MSSEPPNEVTLILYADDCTILSSDSNISKISSRIEAYLNFLNNGLQINSSNFLHNGRPLLNVSNPKVLGITFDQMLMFNARAKIT